MKSSISSRELNREFIIVYSESGYRSAIGFQSLVNLLSTPERVTKVISRAFSSREQVVKIHPFHGVCLFFYRR